MKCLKVSIACSSLESEVFRLACAPPSPSVLELALDGVDGPVECVQMNMKQQITHDMFCASLFSPFVFRTSCSVHLRMGSLSVSPPAHLRSR